MSTAPSARSNALGFRFALIYGALGAVLVCTAIGLVVIARQPAKPKPPAWSSWRPTPASSSKMTQQIVSHISSEYKLNTSGQQMVAIVPGAPEITMDTTVTPVSEIGFQQSANSQCCVRVVSTSRNVQIQLCGLGKQCSLATGTASATRERLLRREALELALYTFKYVPSVPAVIAFLPPTPGGQAFTVLYLERSNLSHELKQPISKTLKLATPPLPTAPDKAESKLIDRLTLPVEYNIKALEPASATAAALVLVPNST